LPGAAFYRALIHFGYTRVVAWGTGVRLVASGGSAIGLALWSGWPGVVIGATALMAGVIAEAAYATVAIRPLCANELKGSNVVEETDEEPLRYGELFWFHLPLAGTALMTLLAQPLVTTQPGAAGQSDAVAGRLAPHLPGGADGAGRGDGAAGSGHCADALDRRRYSPIRRFSLALAVLSVGGMALLALTPLLTGYLNRCRTRSRKVAGLARYGTQLFLLYPALFVAGLVAAGAADQGRATRPVNMGMASIC
jgi:hypothetical protein